MGTFYRVSDYFKGVPRVLSGVSEGFSSAVGFQELRRVSGGFMESFQGISKGFKSAPECSRRFLGRYGAS